MSSPEELDDQLDLHAHTHTRETGKMTTRKTDGQTDTQSIELGEYAKLQAISTLCTLRDAIALAMSLHAVKSGSIRASPSRLAKYPQDIIEKRAQRNQRTGIGTQTRTPTYTQTRRYTDRHTDRHTDRQTDT